MKLTYLASAALAATMLHAPALADRPPSAHIRCDGNPDNITAGETAARLIAITALVGLLVPDHEAPNASLRRSGEEGIAVCTEALAGESNDVRRTELILARAIHRIEAGAFEAAIVDAQLALTDRPEFAATPAFHLSLHLSALEVQAMALFAMGHKEEGAAKAMEMAALAPYDPVTGQRAARYVRLLGTYGPEQQQFYDRLIRLFPLGLIERAWVRQMARDFRGAAEDQELWAGLLQSMSDQPVNGSALAHAALARALAGDVDQAAELAHRASEAIKSQTSEASSASASEVLDLYRIWETAHQGRVAEARLVFAGRSSWSRPHVAAVAEVMRILREGARPEELTGALAQDPDAFRTEPLTTQLEQLNGEKDRFRVIRSVPSQSVFAGYSRNVWRTERSRYLGSVNEELGATFVDTQRDGYGLPSGYALLLHSALVARSRGQSEFMMMPGQRLISANFVRFGSADDPRMIQAFTLGTDQVIADLAPLIPAPPSRR